MTSSLFLPALPADWAPTLETLQAYSLAVSGVPRTYAEPDPRWWHIGLTVASDGMEACPVPLPGGGSLVLRMDLRTHAILITTGGGDVHALRMTAGLAAGEMARRIGDIAALYGLEGDRYAPDLQGLEGAREYSPADAEAFRGVADGVAGAFERRRAGLPGEVGPVHLWPHGFDMSFEWFGPRAMPIAEPREDQGDDWQLSMGFYPRDRAYFYSNPWPFDAAELLGVPLPNGATWHTDGWEGSLLYYDALQGDSAAEQKLNTYADAVLEASVPAPGR